MTTKNPKHDVWTVSRINQDAKDLLQGHFGTIWLGGEVGNLHQPSSGHRYLTLQDSLSQIRCTLFKGRGRYLDFSLENGMRVQVRGKLSLYEPRGEYQFIIEQIKQMGAGDLQAQFVQRFNALKSEGLFDIEHKRPLPTYPNMIGIISSHTGSALADVLKVLVRRYPIAQIRIYPAPAQGLGAVKIICQQLERAQKTGACDLLLLVRGGGSTEDLALFNEEPLVRAVAACTLPLISGIGHEPDRVLVDYAACVRAPTPSAAAELACPDQLALAEEVAQNHSKLQRLLGAQLAHQALRQSQLDQRLQAQNPQRQLQHRLKLHGDLCRRLAQAMASTTHAAHTRLSSLTPRLNRRTLWAQSARAGAQLEETHRRLITALQHRLALQAENLKASMHVLHMASPLSTLKRGYSITTRQGEQTALTSAQQLEAGARIETRLCDGRIISVVEKDSTD